MKSSLAIFFVGFSAILFCTSVIGQNAETGGIKGSMTEAIKHLKMIKENESDSNVVLKYAEISLKHLEAIDRKERNPSKKIKDHDIPGAIIHLQQAIAHAEMGNAEKAKTHIGAALNDMH